MNGRAGNGGPLSRGRGRRAAGGSRPAPEHISSLLGEGLRSLGVHQQVREVQLREAFAEVVGPALASLCRAVSLERGVLLVATRSGALAQQLQLEMPVIVRALNRRLGTDEVRRLRFRPLA